MEGLYQLLVPVILHMVRHLQAGFYIMERILGVFRRLAPGLVVGCRSFFSTSALSLRRASRWSLPYSDPRGRHSDAH